jgi:hypothetical protein
VVQSSTRPDISVKKQITYTCEEREGL